MASTVPTQESVFRKPSLPWTCAVFRVRCCAIAARPTIKKLNSRDVTRALIGPSQSQEAVSFTMANYTIQPLMCGHIIDHQRSCFVYRKDCGGARLHAPCIAWLLRSPEHTLLVDTGPGPRARAPQCYRESEADVDDLLQYELMRAGVDPDSIELVILTHLHNDHVGGAGLFRNARFHVQELELKE